MGLVWPWEEDFLPQLVEHVITLPQEFTDAMRGIISPTEPLGLTDVLGQIMLGMLGGVTVGTVLPWYWGIGFSIVLLPFLPPAMRTGLGLGLALSYSPWAFLVTDVVPDYFSPWDFVR